MSEDQARAVCTWSYPPPYDIYGMGPWSQVIEKGWTLGDARRRDREMQSVVDEVGALLGYVRLSEHDGRWMMGIGLHPEQCGRGLGVAVIKLCVDAHCRAAPGRDLWMEVRDWNTRAIRCYKHAGFVIVDRAERVTGIGPGKFLVMRRSG